MKKNPLKNKAEITLMLILFSTIVFNIVFLNVNAETPTTTVSVVPTSQLIGEEGQPLPASFTIDVTVADVEGLFGWQASIWYSARILNITSVSNASAPGHVFENKNPVVGDPLIDNRKKTLSNKTTVDLSNPIGARWIADVEEPDMPTIKRHFNITGWSDLDGSGTLTPSDIIYIEPNLPVFIKYYYVDAISWTKSEETTTIILDISMARIFYFANLLGEDTFNGAGTLFKITFDAIRPGNTVLNFSATQTVLLNSTLSDIPSELKDGDVTVRGLAAVKDSSVIEIIEVYPTSVDVGSNVTITGRITPSRPGVNVKIEYRTKGTTDGWTELETVVTDSTGGFTYLWNPAAAGTYEIRARWDGDTFYQGAKSDETQTTLPTVTVGGGAGPGISGYLLYIIIGIVIVVAIVAVLYFMKIRKTET